MGGSQRGGQRAQQLLRIDGLGHEVVHARLQCILALRDQCESLVAACAREALEETAWHFRPTALVGVYQWPRPGGDITYLRFAFAGELGEHEHGRILDEGILRAVWMTPDEIRATTARHRSPLIWQCVSDYLAGRRFPLDLVRNYD